MFVGLEVAVNEARGVRLGERARDLGDDADDVSAGRGDRAALEAMVEILALEVLHRDVRRAVPDAVIEDLHDVRALELRGGLGFALEALAHVGRRGGLELR